MDYGDTYNGKNVFTELGFIIQHDRDKLLAANDRKPVNSFDWEERNGSSYYLPTVRTKDAEVSLRCVFAPNVSNEDEFWTFYERFIYQISQPSWSKLYIADHKKTYNVFFLRMENIDNKTKRLSGINRLFIKFNLVLKVAPVYQYSWDKHSQLFPEEYNESWINGNKLLIHKKPVSNKNMKAAEVLTENRYNVILLPNYYKPIATGAGVWEKQCDALVNKKESEIYNMTTPFESNNIFKAIRECYKKEPHYIILYSNNYLINDVEVLKVEVKKAIDKFNYYIGIPLFKQIIIADRESNLFIHKIKVK